LSCRQRSRSLTYQQQPPLCRQSAYRRQRRPRVPQLQLVLPIRKSACSRGLQSRVDTWCTAQPITRIYPERTSFEPPIRTRERVCCCRELRHLLCDGYDRPCFSDNGNVSGARRRDNDATVPSVVTEVPAVAAFSGGAPVCLVVVTQPQSQSLGERSVIHRGAGVEDLLLPGRQRQ